MIVRKDWITVATLLLFTLKVCESNWTLEVFFISYLNPNFQESDRECCVQDCTQTCSSQITVCLQGSGEKPKSNTCLLEKSFYVVSDNMTFENHSVLGIYNSANITNPLRFNVNDTNFRVRLRIVKGNQNVLLSRAKTVRKLHSLSDVQQLTSKDTGIKLQFSYILRCSTNFYGPSCSINCVDTNDDSGHFRCDEDGSEVCLPGYANATPKDRRCTKCDSNICTAQGAAAASVQNSTTESSETSDASDSGLSSGGVAGLTIAVLIVIAVIVGGVIGGILLVIYRPWNDEFIQKRTQSQSNSKSLNNPVYEQETFNPPNQPVNGHARLGLADSNPLYSSKDSMAGVSKEESVFMDNASLAEVLDREEPINDTMPTEAQSNSQGSVPQVNSHAHHTDGPPSHKTDEDCPQDFVPQFDDNTYEDVSTMNGE